MTGLIVCQCGEMSIEFVVGDAESIVGVDEIVLECVDLIRSPSP